MQLRLAARALRGKRPYRIGHIPVDSGMKLIGLRSRDI